MQPVNRYIWFNYISLAFINGLSDAVSIILLHEVFAVLMSGNIIFSFSSLAGHFQFVDFVRLMIIVAFIISNIIAHTFFTKLPLITRFISVIIIIIFYCSIGNYCYTHGYLTKESPDFLYIAIFATVTSVFINSIFYRIHTTQYNLVAYTMNVLNLSHFIAERKYQNAGKILIPVISFATGVFTGAILVKYFQFYTVLFALPLLSVMYYSHHQSNNIINNQTSTPDGT